MGKEIEKKVVISDDTADDSVRFGRAAACFLFFADVFGLMSPSPPNSDTSTQISFGLLSASCFPPIF